jgi:hypothetical protein
MPKGIYKRTKEMKTGKHMLGRKLSDKSKIKISLALKGKEPFNKWGHNLKHIKKGGALPYH